MAARGSTIEDCGWCLVNAELRAREQPEFVMPDRSRREALMVADAAKLLFDIESRDGDAIIDRGVDRMWVIVKQRTEGGYIGVLDSHPDYGETVLLRQGTEVIFGPEHIIEISQPPLDYLEGKYGSTFFPSE